MFELIGLGITAGVSALGHLKSRDWVRDRLRYTHYVQKPSAMLGLVAGGTTAVGVMAVGAVLPFVPVAVFPAAILGLGVGTGVARGAKQARLRLRG